MVRIRDVAAAAGVSVATVSNVLNHPERVTPTVTARVHAAIEELGFVPNDNARQLREGRSTSIGLVVLDLRNPFFTDVARGAEARASQVGLSLILGNSDEDRERESAYLDLFQRQRVHGVLISPYSDIADKLRVLRARGTPSVLVSRGSSDPSFSSVSVDDVAGGQIAIEHLLSIGRRRLAFVGGPLEIQQVSDRLEGARRAVRLQPDAQLEVVVLDDLTVGAGRLAGHQLASRASPPDGVFAANDLVAMGLLQAFLPTGRSALRIPDDIALIGYDDIDFAAAAVVPLTSIRQPADLIGRTAVELLLAEAADSTMAASRVIYQPELIIRTSTVATAI